MTKAQSRKPVSLFMLFLKMGGWIVAIAGLVLLVLSIASSQSLKLAERFDDEGRAAMAMIDKRYTKVERDSDGDRRTVYWLEFTFQTQAGQEVSLAKKVSSSEYNRAEVGKTYDLHYLESAPRTVELTRGANRRSSGASQIIALIVGLCWLAALWIVGGWAVAAVRARRYGAREIVTVSDVVESKIRVNKQSRYRLEWYDTRGRKGSSLLHRWTTLKDYRAGDKIAIYEGVKTSWWAWDVGERPEHLAR